MCTYIRKREAQLTGLLCDMFRTNKLTINSQLTFFSDFMSENQLEHVTKNTIFVLLWIFHTFVIYKLLQLR